MFIIIWKTLKIFTFQYGSIQIDAEFKCQPIDEAFTFQYGSIQITNRPNANGYERLIYIPIWFYSNTIFSTEGGFKGVFTFQYGSIQMMNGPGPKPVGTHLHSNMVLFK